MWTNISKPTGTGYTNVNTAKPSYDEPSLSYDDPVTFYDGISQLAYTNVPKPTGGGSTSITPGMATGLLMNLTYTSTYNFNTSSWTNINKPT